MSETPRFSVTVPAYNAAATLPATVESVQSQTCTDWELVIVDDGSTDTTLEVARRIADEDPRVVVLSQANKGTGGAYNTAVRGARAGLIVMLSADDYILPDHLSCYDAFITENPGTSVFSSAGYFALPDGSREPAGLPTVWVEPRVASIENLLCASFFAVGATYRREVFDAVGGFKENAYVEDYLFWLQAAARGFTHAYLDTPLGVHRRSREQKSTDVVRVRQSEMDSIREVLESGLLSPTDQDLANQAIGRIQTNIRRRRALNTLMGSSGAERLIGWLQTRRS